MLASCVLLKPDTLRDIQCCVWTLLVTPFQRRGPARHGYWTSFITPHLKCLVKPAPRFKKSLEFFKQCSTRTSRERVFFRGLHKVTRDGLSRSSVAMIQLFTAQIASVYSLLLQAASIMQMTWNHCKWCSLVSGIRLSARVTTHLLICPILKASLDTLPTPINSHKKKL